MSHLWQQHEYLCLSYQLHIDSAVAAELLDCHILHPVMSVLLLVGLGVIFLLLPRTGIMSFTIILTFKLLHKNSKSCKAVFRSSGCLSASFMRCSYAFCIHLISFFLFDIMSGFPSVFISSCVNVRINSAVSNFDKQLSMLSESFSKSFISLVSCCCECRENYRPRIFGT